MRKYIIIISVILTVVLVGLVAAGSILNYFTVNIQQPIQFNHKKHIETVGLDCSDCHNYYKTQNNSGRPTIDMCMQCHEEPQTKSPEEEKIRTYAKSKEEIPWKRVYYLADHVRYSHQLHTQKAEIECVECHGNMAEQTSPPKRPLVLHTMKFCIECHKKSGSSVDCLACHK